MRTGEQWRLVDSQNSTLDEFLEGKARLAFVVEWTRHFRIKVSVCRHGRCFFFFAVQALGIGVKVSRRSGFQASGLKDDAADHSWTRRDDMEEHAKGW